MDPLKYNLRKLAYSVADLIEILPIRRTRLYEAVGAGELKPTKFGKRTMFLANDVAAFLDGIVAKDSARRSKQSLRAKQSGNPEELAKSDAVSSDKPGAA